MQIGLGIENGLLRKQLRQGVKGYRLFVPEHLPLPIDRQVDYVGLLGDGFRRRLRHIDLYRVRKQRRGNHKDNQQHKHDVNQRHHIDFRLRLAATAIIETAECHIES